MDAVRAEAPEDHTDYRFFRFIALHGARFSVAGLFFIGFALLASPHRWEIGIFLGMTVAWLITTSLLASMVAYRLYKKRGGVIEKGPRSLPEALANLAGQDQRNDHVAGDQHQRGNDP